MRMRWILPLLLVLALAWVAGADAGQAPRMILALGNTGWLNPANIQAATGALVKQEMEQVKLEEFAVVVLGNIALGSLPGPIQEGLVNYVSKGGSLLITGGSRSFGSGGYQAAASIVPFQIRSESDWRNMPFRPPIALQPGHPVLAGVTFVTVGAVNDMNPRGDASEILRAAGGGSAARGSYPYPLIAELAAGSGRVIGVAMDLSDFAGMPDLPLFVRNTMVYLSSASQMGR